MTDVARASGAPLEAGSSGLHNRIRRWWARSGLITRIAVAVGAVALGLAIVFAVLFFSIVALRHRSVESRHSQEVIATANRLQTLVIDLETAVRGFAITHRERDLAPWRVARAEYPGAVNALVELTEDNAVQHRRALEIKRAIQDYFRQSLPLVAYLRRNPEVAPKVATAQLGSLPVERLRTRFAQFLATETALGEARNDRARRTTHIALIVGGIGLGTALLLILLGALYVERGIARPVRLAADAARRIAGGDLSGRLPTRGPGEVGRLERAFNTMAASLERTMADLEERNRTLVESERVKGELVSNVSHELRTPLASILGFSSLMLNREIAAEERRRYLSLIQTEARRLASLLNDLLDLERVEQETLELRLEDVDVNELLQSQVTLYAVQSDAHDLHFEPARVPLVVQADRDRLAQVIGNLLSNAIKYSPEGGVIDVKAELIGDEVWVWVHDEGLGIPVEHQDRIFTKFFRGDVGRDRGIAGTGLGLVLARQIVEAHGGHIGFDSTAGEGSTFWFWVPARVTEAETISAAGNDAEARHRM